MKQLLIAAFILLVLVQWLVQGKVIWEKNTALRKGKSFRFETMPVDPSDPFRGRYITLRFKIDEFTLARTWPYTSSEEVYVMLDNDDKGFARIKGISATRPSNEPDYVKADTYVSFARGDSVTLHIDYPFSKFFLQEFKAPQAEEDYRNAAGDRTKKTYALVKVYKGDAVIENVYVNDQPLVQ